MRKTVYKIGGAGSFRRWFIIFYVPWIRKKLIRRKSRIIQGCISLLSSQSRCCRPLVVSAQLCWPQSCCLHCRTASSRVLDHQSPCCLQISPAFQNHLADFHPCSNGLLSPPLDHFQTFPHLGCPHHDCLLLQTCPHLCCHHQICPHLDCSTCPSYLLCRQSLPSCQF